MRESELAARIEMSDTLAIDEKVRALQAAGQRVFSFGAGQPDAPTPAPACEAGIEAIRAGADGIAALGAAAQVALVPASFPTTLELAARHRGAIKTTGAGGGDQILAVFTSPERAAGYSTGEQIAEVVWEAATDGKDQVRYVAGQDAKAMYAQRLELGSEAFRKSIRTMFFG